MSADLYVLDASALLAHFERGRGHAKVFTLLKAAQAGEARLLMSDINLGEVYCIIKRRLDAAAAENALLDLNELRVAPVPATWERIHAAAELKADGGLSYADCFAATLTAEFDGVLVTGDSDFERCDDHIRIMWL